ncbi:hypothetical protein AALA24_11450 [Anaerovoracaceae bacterium 42-11]|nr:hypothetical protein [Emergencia sp.]
MSDREFLVETNTQDVIKYIVEEKNISIMNALREFYVSEVFQKLQDYETGLYLESPSYIYDLYKNELLHSGIIQDEI